MAYPHWWSPISCRSSAGQGKFAGQRPTFYHCATPPVPEPVPEGKTNLHFTEARDSEWQWHQLGHMQVCTSLQTDNHASIPPLIFTGQMPFLPPNKQHQSTEGTQTHRQKFYQQTGAREVHGKPTRTPAILSTTTPAAHNVFLEPRVSTKLGERGYSSTRPGTWNAAWHPPQHLQHCTF